MTVTAGCIVIGDDDVRAQQANLQHHPAQYFFFTPGAKRLFGRLRETEIAKPEEVWLGALHLGSRHRLACANHAELFVKLGTDCVLSALAKSREQRNGVNAVLATKNSQRAP